MAATEFVIRSKSGMKFETCEIGKKGEETYTSYEVAEKVLNDIKTLFKNEEFYITEVD
ncbi:hypothetical protein [Niallia sp. 03190]|uniref:hypothetical protein n=1 Tax=Niallia sp. 03190 TaxID=3458061 RepID=UPI004043959D